MIVFDGGPSFFGFDVSTFLGLKSCMLSRAVSKTSTMKSVQTVISHSFAKAKTQVAKGSRKPRERTPEEQRRESFQF